jgi:hypothetical protein
MPFHVMPFETKFLKKWFSPQISSKPPSPQETEQKEKIIEKREKRKNRKRERKRKAPRVSSNKGEVNILREEKHFNFKNPFWCDSIFSPSIIEKVFLTLFDYPLA